MSLDSKTDSLVEQYVRAPQPQSPEGLPQYLEQELQRIEAFTQDASHGSVTVANVEPEVKKKGTVRYAVSPWDPIGGSFQGLVVYNGSAWVRVDTDTNTQNTLSDLGITSSAANINKYTAGTPLNIDSNERVLINASSALGTSRLVVESDTTTENPLTVSNSRSSASTDYSILFYRATNIVGSIQTTLSATSYLTSSDYRLKENVTYDWDATSRLKQLKPARFNYIVDEDTTVDGFLAHEVSSLVPEAISGDKDAVDEDGNPKYQGIDQSKLVPLLVKTIQELEARITALENP